MTCVVAIAHEGTVTMGADSAGVGENWNLTNRRDPKIFRRGDMLIGFTSSFRMGQLLGVQLVVPTKPPKVDLFRWMTTDFIEAVRTCLKDGGYTSVVNNREEGGDFLVGVRGRVFNVSCDFQVGEDRKGFDALGSGQAYAKGVMLALRERSPRNRIAEALKAAEIFSAGVRGPFTIRSLPALRWAAGSEAMDHEQLKLRRR